jgi:hypothetical protein
MKRFSLAIAAVAVLQGGTLFAQNLAGTWQGLMLVSEKPGDTLRVVFKISTSVGGTLTGQMYSLDHGGQAPAPDITLKGLTVKIVMPSVGATYTGSLGGGGNSITGKWGSSSGGSTPLILNLTRATAETAWKIPADLESREDIYMAIQQELGLKLEGAKTATEVIVIDHLEKPSDN